MKKIRSLFRCKYDARYYLEVVLWFLGAWWVLNVLYIGSLVLGANAVFWLLSLFGVSPETSVAWLKRHRALDIAAGLSVAGFGLWAVYKTVRNNPDEIEARAHQRLKHKLGRVA